MLDEQKLRGEGFRGDVAVKLADGQVWYLPKPRVKYARRTKPDGTRGLASRTTFGSDYDTVLQAMYDAIDSGNNFVLAQLNLSAALIQQNYDLTDDQVDTLLALDYSEDATVEDATVRDVILNTAQGQAPKLMGSGDDLE